MKINFFILFGIFFFGKIDAQNISGTILNTASEEPIAHAAIKIGTSPEITFSKETGNFSISIKDFPTELHVSAIGFLNKVVKVENSVENLIIYLNPKAEPLSEVILKSTIIPGKLQQTPAAVAVLTQEELVRFDQTSLVNAMSSAAGVYVHQGALNTNKLSIRGLGSRSQYSTNRVKAYFEGIPISSAEGITTLDDIPAELIERVEIIKGPTSSLYGAGLGGVINLYARNPQELGTAGRIKSTFGSFGLMRKSVGVSHASINTGIMANFNRLQSDGFRENGEYERNSFTFHGKIHGNASNELSFLANFIRLKAYIPSSLNKEQLEYNPTSAALAWGVSRGYESYDKGLFGLTYRQNFSDGFYNTSSAYMNFRDAYEPRPFNILREKQIGLGAKTKFNFATKLLGLPTKFSVGAEYFKENYDIATLENLYEEFPGEGSVAGRSLSNNSQDRSYANFFAQWNLSLSKTFKLETGLNINTTQYELTDFFTTDSIDQSGNYQFETVLSPRFGASYSPMVGKTFYASISHGFSNPTVAETLTPTGLINTALQPEMGINYEIGFKGYWFNSSFYSEIALYSIQINNLIVAERVGRDQYIGRNVGKTNHNGIEILLNHNIQVTPTVTIKPYVNAAFNFFKFEDFTDNGSNFSGNSLPGVPDKTISAGIDIIAGSGFKFYLIYNHVGKIPLNDANSSYNARFNLFHLKSSHTITFGDWEMEIFAGINNIFDEAYAASIVTNAVGFDGALPRYFYPGKPRNYFSGIGLEYAF